MRMRPSNVSTGQAVFEFGYGLSYTTFSYTWYNDSTIISYAIESFIKKKSNIENVLIESFRVNVTNTGTMNGDDVILAYIILPQVLHDDETSPSKQLFSFERINLNVEETKQVFFPFNIESILTIARDDSKWLHPGQYNIRIGNQHMFTMELHGDSALWQVFK